MFLKLAFTFVFHCYVLLCFHFVFPHKRNAPELLIGMNSIEYILFLSKLSLLTDNIPYQTITTGTCITNIKSRTSYQELWRGSSLVRKKTKDLPEIDFLIILHRHTITTRHGLCALATVCSTQDQFKLYSPWAGPQNFGFPSTLMDKGYHSFLEILYPLLYFYIIS